MKGVSDVDVMLGDPRKAVRAMALPLLLSLLVAELNVMIDRSWCAGLGEDTLAAIAVVEPIYLVIVGLGSGLGVGVSAVISRHIGSGSTGRAESCAMQAIMFSIVFGLILTPIMLVFNDGILDVIGSDDINHLAGVYMFNMMAFSTVLIINGVIAGLLRGEGAANQATVMIVISAVVNVVLDPVFIYTLGMGISGASLATVASFMVSTVYGLLQYTRRKMYIHLHLHGFRFERDTLADVLRMGVPQMLEYTVMYSMNIVLNYLVISCAGSTGLTIYSVPNVIVNMAVIPAMAIGSALVPVASSAFGQGDTDRMKLAYRYSLKLALVTVLAICAVIVIFPDVFLYIFTYTPDTEALRDEMALALRIYSIYLPFFTLIPIGSSLLQALMMPNRSVVLAVVRNVILIAFYWIAAQYDLYWIFWAVVAGEVIGGLMMYAVAGYSFKRRVSGTRPDLV